ncbi:hypothetical protein HaLaN_17309 [Haematococcus lacustris]|uniref:Uncharacterized protein n=1 Tax=Haematococcus lacustris TaxID=44745 RepID=A0A699ZDM2_HAELA|nr:hypothetical protein HaLaN_17309 [Haematococcus lacustris]
MGMLSGLQLDRSTAGGVSVRIVLKQRSACGRAADFFVARRVALYDATHNDPGWPRLKATA